jgi:hypothetical protein
LGGGWGVVIVYDDEAYPVGWGSTEDCSGVSAEGREEGAERPEGAGRAESAGWSQDQAWSGRASSSEGFRAAGGSACGEGAGEAEETGCISESIESAALDA